MHEFFKKRRCVVGLGTFAVGLGTYGGMQRESLPWSPPPLYPWYTWRSWYPWYPWYPGSHRISTKYHDIVIHRMHHPSRVEMYIPCNSAFHYLPWIHRPQYMTCLCIFDGFKEVHKILWDFSFGLGNVHFSPSIPPRRQAISKTQWQAGFEGEAVGVHLCVHYIHWYCTYIYNVYYML